MGSANQVLALVKSHVDGDDKQFLSVAMQVAAQEARLGHGNVALQLRRLIDQARDRSSQPPPSQTAAVTFQPAQPKGDLATLLSVSYPRQKLRDLVLPSETSARLERIVHEQAQQEKLLSHGLTPRRKILLVGPPGSGKTMTAHALAGELQLPLMTLLFEGIITKFMGETAAKLRLVFEAMTTSPGVYFFDEFDAIGTKRDAGNDVGEIRRVLNSFLQLLERDSSRSLIIAATNHPELLDTALFRRFDDVLEYSLPTDETVERLLRSRLATFAPRRFAWKKVVGAAEGLSHAEVTRATEEAAKKAILEDRSEVTINDLLSAFAERRSVRR